MENLRLSRKVIGGCCAWSKGATTSSSDTWRCASSGWGGSSKVRVRLGNGEAGAGELNFTLRLDFELWLVVGMSDSESELESVLITSVIINGLNDRCNFFGPVFSVNRAFFYHDLFKNPHFVSSPRRESWVLWLLSISSHAILSQIVPLHLLSQCDCHFGCRTGIQLV